MAVKAAVKDKKAVNGLIPVFNHLDLDEDPSKLALSKAVASMRALVEAFQQFTQMGDLDEADKEDDDDDEAVKQVRSWLRQRHDQLWQKICSLLCHDDDNMAEVALVAAFRLIKSWHRRQINKNGGSVPDHWSGDEVKRLRQIIPHYCSANRCMANKIKRLREYLDFVDVKQQFVLGVGKYVRQKAKDGAGDNIVFVRNVCCVLENLNFYQPRGEVNTLLCREGEGEDKSVYDFDYESGKKQFSDLWESYLRLKFDVDVYKRTLLLVEKAMPHLARPLLLTDFLVESYSVGGAVGVLALGGVFALIQKHNLEYPDFYAKLYALFKPEVLHAK